MLLTKSLVEIFRKATSAAEQEKIQENLECDIFNKWNPICAYFIDRNRYSYMHFIHVSHSLFFATFLCKNLILIKLILFSSRTGMWSGAKESNREQNGKIRVNRSGIQFNILARERKRRKNHPQTRLNMHSFPTKMSIEKTTDGINVEEQREIFHFGCNVHFWSWISFDKCEHAAFFPRSKTNSMSLQQM